MTTTRGRRWCRFSLKALLALVSVMAVVLAIFTNRVREERNSARSVHQLGGHVQYAYQRQGRSQPMLPGWVRNFTGDGVVGVDLRNASVTGPELAKLAGLRNVWWLHLSDAEIGDGDLEDLRSLPRLRWLFLSNCDIGDDGLTHVATLSELDLLDLNGTRVTDDGL